jgi:hypothetical protein
VSIVAPITVLVAAPIVVLFGTLVAMPTPIAIPVVVKFFVKYCD